MNPLNRFFLHAVLLPAALYRNLGVQVPQLAAILRLKLMMDDRRPASIMQASRKTNNKPVKNASLGTMVVSVIIGLAYLLAFMMGRDPVSQFTFYFVFFFFMLSASLISDFTSVLIDVRDSFIILPKPVNDRTVLLGRLLHILIHISRIVLPMAVPGLVYVGVSMSWGAALVMLPFLAMLTAFCLFFINALYLVILRFTTPEKFRTIIGYIQIIFAIVFYAGYQVFPRLTRAMELNAFSFNDHAYALAIPMYWFAAGWSVVYELGGNNMELAGAVLGVVVPLLGIYVVIRFLAPSFNSRLSMINSGSTASKPRKVRGEKSARGYSAFLSRLFTRNKAERMGFVFSWKMMARSRDFKLKVYPAIGYLAVYIFLTVFQGNLIWDGVDQDTTEGKILLLTPVYFTSLILTTAISHMMYSERFKASWIFYTLPLEKPGDVILGATKAAILSFYIPIVVVIMIAATSIVGVSVLPNMILALFNQLLISSMLVYAANRYFPFSMQLSNNVKRGSFLRNLAVLFFSGIVALLHYFIFNYTYLVILCALLSIIATWLLMAAIRNTSWQEIKNKYED